MSRYWSKTLCSEGGGHFERKFKGQWASPPTNVDIKIESSGYHAALFA